MMEDMLLVPIPDVFKHSVTKDAFAQCCECGIYLLELGVEYSVEKLFMQFNDLPESKCFLEYALCGDCVNNNVIGYSISSVIRLENYWANKFDAEAFFSRDYSVPFHVDEWLDRCIFTNQQLSKQKVYQITCPFNGEYVSFEPGPHMVSASVLQEMNVLLSRSSQKVVKEFVLRNSDHTPEIQAIILGDYENVS